MNPLALLRVTKLRRRTDFRAKSALSRGTFEAPRCQLDALRSPRSAQAPGHATTGDAMIDLNGIAHIQLSVRDFAASRDFYHWLLHETLRHDRPSTTRRHLLLHRRPDRPADPARRSRALGRRASISGGWAAPPSAFASRSREDVDTLHRRAGPARPRRDRACARRRETGRPATTRCCSRIRTASAWKPNFVPGRGNLAVIGDGPPLTPGGSSAGRRRSTAELAFQHLQQSRPRAPPERARRGCRRPSSRRSCRPRRPCRR